MSNHVTVARYYSPTEAESARVSLAHEGIEGTLSNLSVVTMDWLLMNAVGGIQLQVAEQDVVRAMEILKEHETKKKAKLLAQETHVIRFACSECSAPLEVSGDRRGGVETCDHCGEYIDVPDVSDEEMIAKELTLDPDTPVTEAPARRIPLIWELGCFLLFVYVPTMGAAVNWFGLSSKDYYFEDVMTGHVSVMLSIVPPLLLILYVRNEPWSKFGIKPPRWLVDPLLAFGLWFVATIVWGVASLLLTSRPIESMGYAEQGFVDLRFVILCCIGLTANSIVEELTMRGYLIPRLEELTKSSAFAVIVSSALFASYHIYQGVPNALAIFAFGLVYALFFYWCRRLWPLIIAHTMTNLILYLT